VTRLRLRVSPKAKRNAVQGLRGDALKMSVTAAPERGRANDAVIALLAEALDLPGDLRRVDADQPHLADAGQPQRVAVGVLGDARGGASPTACGVGGRLRTAGDRERAEKGG